MALTFTTQVQALPPTTIGPGVRMAVVNISQNATVTAFSIVSPLSAVVRFADARAIGSADTANTIPACSNTMNAAGLITLGAGGTLSFAKTSTAQQDYTILILGA